MSEPTEVGHRRAAPKEDGSGLLDLAMVAPVAMAAVSLDRAVLAVNKRFTRLFGYVREDVPTLEAWWAYAFPDPSYRSEMVAGWDLLVGGARDGREIGPVERRITSKSGEERVAEVAAVVRDGAVLVTFTDLTHRRRAEGALLEARALTEAIFQGTEDLIWTVDARDLRLLTFNGAISRYFQGRYGIELKPGASPEEILGTEESAALWRGAYQRALREGACRVSMVARDGVTRLDAQLHPVRIDGRVRAVAGFARDVTDLLAAEARAGESEGFIEAIFESTSDLVWSADAQQFGITAFNRGLREYFQKARGIGVRKGDRPEELFPPGEWVERWKEIYRKALRDGPCRVDYSTYNGERTLDLHVSPIVRGGEPVGVAVFGRDVTAERKAVATLRSIVASMGGGVVIRDRSGTILLSNDAAQRILGLASDEMAGRTSLDRHLEVVREDGTPFEGGDQPAMVALRTGAPVRNVVMGVRKPGGVLTWILANAEPIRDAAGGVSAVVTTFLDVTELRQAEAMFRHSQKLESVGRLAGGVAHDFNNLLAAIIANGEEIRDVLASGARVEPESVEEILDAGHRGAALTRQLLSFARKQPTRPELVDVGAAVQNVLKLLRRVLGDDVAVLESHEPAPWRVWCDAAQLGQVVMNLVLNARDAMPQGGSLTVSTANVQVESGLPGLVEPLPPGRYVRLAVSDAGHGMSPEVMEHLFEPFFTTKAPGQGTGLGLATVFGIVRQAGGSLRVESKPGRGSRFEVFLPRREAAPEQGPTPGNLDGPGVQGGETVLVVEDDPQVLRATVRSLARAGFDALPAGTLEEAIRRVQEHPRPPALLVTDVRMPGTSGLRVSRVLSERIPGLRTIFMSGRLDEISSNGEQLPANSHVLPKPFSIAQFLGTIREALRT